MPSLALSNAFLSSRSYVCPLRLHHARSPPSSNHRRSGTISCASSKEEEETNIVMDRRGVLLGLGALYGSAAKMAAGAPIAPPPDFKTWRKATSPGVPDQDHASLAVRDYPFPKTPLRVRRAAQNVDKAYVDKINEAVSRMKNLPANDPWNFYQQVHGSRLFLPWNRIYLHFYERILGKLIGDDTFALPFWNWDAPDGMTFPQIFFRDPNSVLYNANADRNPTNTPIAIIESEGPTWQELIGANVEQIRIAFRESLNNATLFKGEDAEGAGILENIHNSVQLGVETRYPDLGNFVSNGRDHHFYGLHANVDRLWDIYGNIGGRPAVFHDSDWLESAFIFYDEFRQPTRVKVGDSLDSRKFGYTYETVPLPWLGEASRREKAAAATAPKTPANLVTVSEFGPTPRDLDSTIRVLVPRPKTNRSDEEKEEELEVLTTTGIQVNTPGPARFDVFIAKPYNGNQAGPDLGQYVGAFVKLASYTPQAGPNGPGRKQGLKLGITYAIEDIGAHDASSLVVSFKPRDGKVTIGGVEIKLIETDIKL